MTGSTTIAEALLREFEGPWRDDTPVFGCCRRAVQIVVERSDLAELTTLGVTERVHAMRASLEEELPGHLDAHRCCAGHLADLAFDLPDLVAPVQTS